MPIAEDSAGGSPVPIPTNLTTNLTGEATGSGTLDYTTGDIDIAVTVVDNGHNHILSNITDVQVNNAISGQILVYNGTVWANATNTSGITAIVQDLTPELGGNLNLNGKNINGNGNINLADNYKLTLGTGNDLEISHDGVSSYIRDVGAGDLQIFASDDVYIRGQGSNTYMARFNESGAVTLYHNNVIRLITTDSGITVTDEVEAAEFIGPLRGPTKFKGQAGEALSAGDPVYISGISGNTTVVSKADANDASKMPAFGIIDASVSANATCQVLTFGEMHNLDTSAFSEGDELYVSNTGTLTTAIPSGESSQIQKIAKVTRSHASAGGIFIMGAGRSNAVPNLDNGDIFIGDGTNHATTTSLNTAVNALTLTNYLPLSGGAMTGNITTSGTFDGRDVSVDGAKLDGIATGADVTLNEISAGTNVTISAGGVISSTASGGLAHVVDDTTPQLGGNLDLNSNDITGTGNLNFTGSVTLSGTVDGRDVAADGTKLDGIEASADVTDTANVTAAGALMDSEVTNLAQVKAFDSSDYATAAQGTTADAALPKAGGTMTGDILFNDNVKAKFGNGDLQIYHDSSHSYIKDSGTGNLFIDATSLRLRTGAGTETYLTADGNGSVDLYYDNVKKFETTSSGIDVTGNVFVNRSQTSGVADLLTLRDASAGAIYNFETYADPSFGTSNRLNYTGQYFAIRRSGTEQMRFTSTGIDVTGDINSTKSGGSTLTLENSITSISANELIGGIDFKGNDTSEDGNEVLAFIRAHALDTTPDSYIAFGTLQNNGGVDDVVTERMRIDNYGRLGVGTSAPTAKMHLFTDGTDQSMFSAQADLGAQNRILTLKSPVSDSTTQPFRWQTSNSILWEIDGTESKSMNLNSVGNLGVGTLSPTYKIDARGAANSDVAIQVKASGTGDVDAELRLDAADTGEALVRYARDGTTRAISEYTNSNEWNFTTYNADVIDFQPNSTHVMRIKHNGNVGIGTTTCADKLHVEGNVYLGTSSRSVYTGGGGDLRLQTNTGEVKVLTANGATTNLITVGTGIRIPANLQVDSTIEVGSLTPAQDGAIEVGVIALGTPAIASTTSSTGLMNHIIFDNPNGVVGKINTNNSATSYLTSSDYRLKTDVQAMTGSIDRLKALRPVNFEWIVDGTRIDGFLAHEAQEVVPEAVDGEKDAMRDQQYVESEATGDIYTPAVEATYETIQVELTPAVEATYDEDGNELTPAVDATYEEQQQELTPAIDEVIHSSDVVEPDELEEGQRWRETTEKVMATRQVPDYQGIDQSKIVPLLTSALQDAIAKIEALETRLEALES
jgi:hypothetical protein